MGNLTAGQLAAITSGQPIRQTWSIIGVAAKSNFGTTLQTTVIDEGIFAGPGSLRRIVKAGSRTYRVLNPHPQDNESPKAVRYVIEVDNSDGYFHKKLGSVWSPSTYNADPRECQLIHSLSVLSGGVWSSIAHMEFTGQVIDVFYSGGATKLSTGVGGRPVPNTATIVTEQIGAETTLRRIFKPTDADIEKVTDGTSGDLEETF